jgi:hypothetical protein
MGMGENSQYSLHLNYNLNILLPLQIPDFSHNIFELIIKIIPALTECK